MPAPAAPAVDPNSLAELLDAVRELVAAEDLFAADTGLKTDDPITEALERTRAALVKFGHA